VSNCRWRPGDSIGRQLISLYDTSAALERVGQLTGLRSELVVADTELVEQPSGLVAAAQKAGCLVIDGLEVYVEKTAIDFQVLTGTAPDPDMLREALEEFLSA
jgi:shikimate 5-dehydrogenase